ncbi:MAG: hypothetical protein K6D97_01335 [Clostridia bacterium]|nr:hypothetical protein [Clostridia bacterium]
MIDSTYEKSFTEVYEIIHILDEKIKFNIPSSFIKFIENNRDANYVFNYDFDKPLDEQKLSEEAQTILAIIFRNYICTNEEKIELDNALKKNDEQFEKNLYEDIFNNSNTNSHTSSLTQNVDDSNQLIKYKENIISKLIKRIKIFFKIQK